MSINDKNYGRGKIVMLALMMVTSTFAAIGTTVAQPTHMEHVWWSAENGEMFTHEDEHGHQEHVYEYGSVWDAVYDFKFVSDGLEMDNTYEINIKLVDMVNDIPVIDEFYSWDATDYDGDGVADNSSEFLVMGDMVDYISNDTCYDAVAHLFVLQGDGTFQEIGGMNQLIGFGAYDCHYDDWEEHEHLTMEFRDANYDNPQPHYNDYTEANILLIPSGLHESQNWCENMSSGEDLDLDETECNADENNVWIEETLTYDVHYWLFHHETGFDVEVTFEEVVDGMEYLVEISDNGCYDLMATLFINLTWTADGQTGDVYDPVTDSMEGFSVGHDCFGEPEPISPWSKADREFNPERGIFGYYGVDEPVYIEYGAWGLEPYTTYTSVLHIFGPFMPHDEDHHEEPSFICGDGSEIPFEYVNDGDEDCPLGADEQQYNDDGTKVNWFDCHDGSQIWIDQVNDGIEDCPHGEDEAGDHHDEHDHHEGDETHGHQTDGEDCGEGTDDTDCNGIDDAFDDDDAWQEEDDDHDNHDNHDNHDEEESDGYCYDEENEVVTDHPSQEDCEISGLMWIKTEEHEAHPEPTLSVMMDHESEDNGDFMHVYEIDVGVLEPGIYAVAHVIVDSDGHEYHQFGEPEMFCVSEELCTMPDMDPYSHTTGYGYYQMHFDQFETFVDDESGESFNGVLELSSVQHMDASYRMFADANEDGMVDPMEALMFLEMMSEDMNDDDHHHMDDECPFDMDNPDSPCNYEPCDPMGEEYDDSACHSKVEAYCADNPEDEGCHMDDEENHDGHDHGDHEDDGTHGNSADGRHCVAEGEVCPEDGGDDHDHDDQDDEEMVCYDMNSHTVDPALDNQADCEAAGLMWTTANSGPDDNDDDDDTFTVALDGNVLGEPNHEWIWIDGLVGPVDGSDGMSVSIMSGSVWLLSLEDWETTEQHVVSLYNSDNSAMVEECMDGVRDNDAETGLFAVYDSWAWSPVSVEAEGEGWIPEANEEHGWTLPYDCDSGELNALSVVFSKTVKDYNADNLDHEDIEPGPEADWEVDVEDNQAPTCHVFASVSNGTDWEEGEEHFEAPNGDHTIELMAGMWYLSIYCKDPDGDMVMGQVTFTDVTYEFLEEGEGHAYTEFMAIEGMPNVTFDYKWDSTGGHSGAGSITLVVLAPENNADDIVEPTTNDDGTLSCPDNLVLSDDQTQCVAPSVDNVGDIIEEVAADESGSIPGFTSTLSVISMLGAVLVMSRRKQDC